MSTITEVSQQVIANIERVIIGKREQIELLLVALLCQGHVLIEDVPGTGKTMLARAAAASLDLRFKRVQCTPDLLPNDITGVSVWSGERGTFEFQQGPIFSNVVLADEINRATPRTQAALLEAMQERQVSADGVTRPLPAPFLVLATQNPVEYEGTFPLPEAQLDRFLLQLALGYPAEADELALLTGTHGAPALETLGPVASGDDLLRAAAAVEAIHVDESLARYIVALVRATRQHPDLALGASPRGSLALHRAAQALAALRGRDYVTPDDVKQLARPTLTHRLIVRPESQLRGRSAAAVLGEVLERTPLALTPTLSRVRERDQG